MTIWQKLSSPIESGSASRLVMSLFAASLLSVLPSQASAQAANSWFQSTVASGLSASPGGTAVDASGNVYIADAGNQQVLFEVPTGNGTFTQSVIANASTTGISTFQPNGVAVDPAGNVFISDYSGNVVELTLAGGSSPGGSYTPSVLESTSNGMVHPSGIAVPYGVTTPAGDTEFIFVSDSAGQQVFLVEKEADGFLAGGPLAAFNCYTVQCVHANSEFIPTGVAVDAALNLYITDSGNNVVYVMQAGGGLSYTSLTQIGVVNLANPAGITLDANDDIYIANNGDDNVLELTPSSPGSFSYGESTVYAGGLYAPTGVAVDASGNLYVSQYDDVDILSDAVEVTHAAGNFGSVNMGSASTSPVTANFYFNSSATVGSISVLTDGIPLLDFSNANSGTCTPSTPYTAGQTCSVDVNFTPSAVGTRNGAVSLLDGSGNVLGTAYVTGIGYGPQLNFLYPYWSVGPQFNELGQPSDGWALGVGGGMAVDASGNIYLVDSGNNRVLIVVPNPAGNFQGFTQYVVNTSTLNNPNDVAVDGAGNLYITDLQNNRVLKETPTSTFGTYTETTVDTTLVGTTNCDPTGVAVDSSGIVYVSCDSSNLALKETPAAGGGYIRSVLPTSNLPNGAYLEAGLGIAVDGSGNVYIANTNFGQIIELTPFGNSYTASILPFTGLGFIYSIAVDNVGNLFITNPLEQTVVKETLSGGSYTQSIPFGPDTGYPTGVAVDGQGNLYVADSIFEMIFEDEALSTPPPGSLIFEPTSVGGGISSDSPETIATVANIGNAPLVFEAPTSGSNPSITAYVSSPYSLESPSNFALDTGGSSCPVATTAPVSLAAGATCQLNVSFTPLVAGTITGYLSLTDNFSAGPPNYATQTFYFEGVGLKPAAILSPAPGSTLTGGSATFTWSTGADNTDYVLRIGTTGVGSTNLYQGPNTTNRSVTISNLPFNGETIYVRLWSLVGGSSWQFIDYTYTAFTGTAATIISPSESSPLSGTSQLFTWGNGVGVTEYVLRIGSTGVGSTNLYSGPETASLSATINNLPINGETIYVRLWSLVGGTWQYNDYTYTAFTGTAATMISPSESNPLSGASQLFTWGNGVGVTEYVLRIGSTGVGSANLYNGAETTAMSATVNNLPINGETLYVRLSSLAGGFWLSNDYTYTAFTGTAATLNPLSTGSTLSGVSQLFTWTAGTGDTQYALRIGSTGVGSANLYNGAETTSLSTTVNGLPLNGEPVYVRLLSLTGGFWLSNDYTFTAFTAAPATLTDPTPGALGVSQLFSWQPGAGDTLYQLRIGTTGVGSANLYNGPETTNTSVTVNNLPRNGETVYVQLSSLAGGLWLSNDYTFTAFTGIPATLNPLSTGSTLGGASQLFTWTAGVGVTQYELRVGSTGAGSSDLYNGPDTTNLSVTVSHLPTNGETVYVRLSSLTGGLWLSNDYTFTAY